MCSLIQTQAMMSPPITHARAEALRNTKTDLEVNGGKYKTYHGSDRSSSMNGFAEEATGLRLKSRAFGDDNQEVTDLAEAGRTFQPIIAHQDEMSGAPLVQGDLPATLLNLRPSGGQGDNYNIIPVSMTNYVVPICWKMSQGRNPLFKSALAKQRIQSSAEQADMRRSEFWLHPVRYEPALEEPNVLRTVQIDHIPRHLGVQEVLREVCCGKIESIQLVDLGHIRGPQVLMPAPYQFARIVFHQARDASRFQQYSHAKPLTLAGQQVRVYLQLEPTYPRTAEVDEAIFDLGLTRILSVFGLTDPAVELLPPYLKSKGLELVSLAQRSHKDERNGGEKRKTVLEFRSVLHALRALRAMEKGGYAGAKEFMVEPDYCARNP
jgi:hypothetical protein